MLDLSSWQAKAIFTAMAVLIGFFPVLPGLLAGDFIGEAGPRTVPPDTDAVPKRVHARSFPHGAVRGRVAASSDELADRLALFGGNQCNAGGLCWLQLCQVPLLRGASPSMLFMLSAQMFPFGLLLITIYPMFTNWGLLDSRFGLMISYIVFALPVATYMLYSYFSQVPNELIEAARADGASDLRILHTIVLPISVPPIVTVFLYSFMWSWNDLLYSLTLIVSDDKRTVGPGLLLNYLNESNADWGGCHGGVADGRGACGDRFHGRCRSSSSRA